MKHASPTRMEGSFCQSGYLVRPKRTSFFGLLVAIAGLPFLTSATPGPVVQLLWTTQPGQTFINAPFGRQPVLVTADAKGNPSTVDLPGSVPVTVSLVSGGTLLGGPLSFDIGTNAGASNGIATFSALEIDTVGSYTLQAVTGSGFSGVFTPTNGLPNCILWLDAADTNTFQLNTSNGIVVWADKSGTANNAVWSGVTNSPLGYTNPPLPYNAPASVTDTNFPSGTWGGQKVVFFNGTNYYNLKTLMPLLNSPYTIVAVDCFFGSTAVDNLGTGGGSLIGNDYNNTQFDSVLEFGYRNSTEFTIQQYGDDINYTSSGGWGSEIPRLWTGMLDNSLMQHIFLDGVDVADRQAGSYFTNMAAAHVGVGGGGAPYNGEIAEMLVYNTNLTDVQREGVESYLLNKWQGQFSYTGLSTTFFVAANSASTVSGIYFSQQPTATVAGNTITPSVTVTVTNSSGNPISGVSVILSVLSGPGPLNGTLTQVSANNGVATFPDLNITVAGTYQIQAQVPGAATNNSAVFSISTAPASQLVLLTQPSANEVAGVPFAVQPVVAVEDAYGNILSNNTDTIVAYDIEGYNIDATSSGQVSVAAVKGVATFSGLYLTNANPNEQINFVDNTSSISAASDYINVTGNGPVSMLVETEPSSTGNIGVPFSTQPVVELLDTYGNFASNGTPVSVSGGSVTLLGPTNTFTANGIATFSGLYTTNLGNLTLTFTAGTLSAVSTPINIQGGPATSVVWATQPGSAVQGSPFGQQPVLKSADAGGNLSTLDLAATNWVSVTLESGGELTGGPLLVNIGVNGSNGVVSFQNLQVNQAMTNAVLAARVIGAQLTPTNGIPNCVLWLDSGDPSTLVITNGYITTWLDKSGTTNNGAASSTSLLYSHNAAIPSFAWGGQNLVTFSNNGQFNVNLSNLVSNTYSILSIEVNDNLPGKSYAEYYVNTTYEGVDGTLGFGYQTGNSFRLQQYADDTTYTLPSGTPYFTNVAPQPRIWSAINDVTNLNGNNDEWLYYNGAPVAGGGGHHYLSSVVGAHIGGGNCYQGLAEIAIYNTNLTDIQRSNVESYFVTKWEQNSMAATVPFVVYPSNPSVSIIGPAGESTNGNAAASVTVDLSGIPGKSYRLQATTNLASTNWVTIGTNTGGSTGTIQFIDTGATNYPDRYYRAVSP